MTTVSHWVGQAAQMSRWARTNQEHPNVIAEDIQMIGDELGLALAQSKTPEQNSIFSA